MATFDLQYRSGTFDPSKCLTENNLIQNANLRPDIYPTLIKKDRGYTLEFLSEILGESGKGIREVNQRTYEWAVQGRPVKPITFKGYVSGTGASDGLVIATSQQNYANLYDMIKTEGGYKLIVVAKPTKTASGYTYKFKSAGSVSVPSSEFANGKRAGIIGQVFPDGSKEGYGNVTGLDWYQNYTTITRKGISVDNSLLTAVTWVTNPVDGSQYWYFDYEAQLLEQMQWQKEQQKWFGVKTTADFGDTWNTDEEDNSLIAGAGFIEQVQGANADTYIPGVDNYVDKIKARINDLILYGGASVYDNITCHTGSVGGADVFDAGMRSDFKEGYKTIFQTHNKMIDVGEVFPTYMYKGKKITLMPNNLFIDPEIHVGTSIQGLPAEAYNMYFIPVYKQGEQNIDMFYRKSMTGNRRFISKKIAGMESPYPGSPEWVASGFDGFKHEMLSEWTLAVKRPFETAQLIATAS